MMAPLTTGQLNDLAALFSRVATDIGTFLSNADDTLDDHESQRLAGEQQRLDDFAETLAVKAAQTAFADADGAFRQLTSAMKDAEATARQLAADTKQITKIIAIAAAVVDLGGALASGDAVAVGKTLVALSTAASG